jgi:hypothetical protein
MIASCKACQQKKADKSCKEAGMFPRWTPKEPMYSERFLNNIRIASSAERNNWKLGFKKLGLTDLLEGSL